MLTVLNWRTESDLYRSQIWRSRIHNQVDESTVYDFTMPGVSCGQKLKDYNMETDGIVVLLQ